jgi:hypothetical protein
MTGAFDVPGKDVMDTAMRAHRRVEGIDRRARQTESVCRAFDFQNPDGGIDRSHPRHYWLPFPDSRSTPNSSAE